MTHKLRMSFYSLTYNLIKLRGLKVVKEKKIGMVTIAQSPREDIVPEIRRIGGINAKIIECGALDELTLKQIEELAPKPGEYVLVLRLKDGTYVKAAMHHLISRVQICIESLSRHGVDLIIVLCMGEFPEFKSEKLVVEPSKFFSHIALGLLSEEGKLGVLVPVEDQIEDAKKLFKKGKIDVYVAAGSPYGPNADEKVMNAAKKLKEHDVDLIAANCPGYTLSMKKEIEAITGKPVLLARSVIAWVTKELAS